MCLQNLDFSTYWDEKEQKFVGVGFKKIHKSNLNIDSLGRVNHSKKSMYKIGKWLEATFRYQILDYEPLFTATVSSKLDGEAKTHYKLEDDNSVSLRYKSYPPGFHIFIEPESARDYNYIDGDVYTVMYSNILCYGTNTVRQYTKIHKPCVVAQYMKIIGKYQEPK